MSLPDKLVLNRFIDDYLEIRKSTWHSALGKLKEAGRHLADLTTQTVTNVLSALPSLFSSAHQPPPPQEEEKECKSDEVLITNVCRILSKKIETANSVQDWIKLAMDLGDEAREAFKRDQNSLFCKMLHAARTYLISHIRNDDAYKHFVAELSATKPALEAAIKTAWNSGHNIAKALEERNKILYHLADLDDDDSIFDCFIHNLFLGLKSPDRNIHKPENLGNAEAKLEINPNKPWYYQATYYLRYHNQNIRLINSESFEGFKQRAMRKEALINKPADTSAESTNIVSNASSLSSSGLG